MKIIDVIGQVKSFSAAVWNGVELKDDNTRDKILWGNAKQECSGIVTTCFASTDVIRRAAELGCNLIIAHESLFWNHGDDTKWLSDNTAFQTKRELLNRYGICVFRCHDYMHAGIGVDGTYRDGIFYGMSTLLGWNDYARDKDAVWCHDYCLPHPMTVPEIAGLINEKFRLKGVRFIGNSNTKIQNISCFGHIMGHSPDREIIERINRDDIHCLFTMEMVDFTVCEYIRDAAMAGENKCIFALGHFNAEEIGMEFYADYLGKRLSANLPVHFVQSGDAYTYIPAVH